MGSSKDLSTEQIGVKTSMHTSGYCNKDIHNLTGSELNECTALDQNMSKVGDILPLQKNPLVDSGKLTQGQ